jgi:putative DNA primase/helicase
MVVSNYTQNSPNPNSEPGQTLSGDHQHNKNPGDYSLTAEDLARYDVIKDWPVNDLSPSDGRIYWLVQNNPNKAAEVAAAITENGKIILSTFADMVNLIGSITWSWDKWLPCGVLTILAGEPGSGKSSLALRVAACFLRGDPWPDGTPFTGDPGAVIWCEAEAGQAMNLQRAKAWRLPLDQLYTAAINPLEDFSLTNETQLSALRKRAELQEVKLIVVDSLSGADSRAEKSSEDASSVKWLAELARDLSKPILLTHHLRKRGMFDGDSVDIDRLRGSSAIVQTARLVWALDTPDPQAKAWKRLQVVKSNLAAFPEPLGLTVDANGIHFGLAPSQPKPESALDRAIDLLRALLQNEPKAADEIYTEFDGAGISEATMKRAKEKLGIVSRKDKTGWTWAMPVPKDYDS